MERFHPLSLSVWQDKTHASRRNTGLVPLTVTGSAPDAMPREIESDSETNATVAAGARLCRMALRIGIGPVAVLRMPSIGPFGESCEQVGMVRFE